MIIGTKIIRDNAGIMDIINFKHKKLPYVAVWAAAIMALIDSNNSTTTYLHVQVVTNEYTCMYTI